MLMVAEAIVRNYGVRQRSALKKRGHGAVKVIAESFHQTCRFQIVSWTKTFRLTDNLVREEIVKYVIINLSLLFIYLSFKIHL